MYRVYSTVNNNGLINEDILLETDDKQEAINQAREAKAYNKLELKPEKHNVEIRFNENFETGTYETIDF